jgi:hypothetical protein
LGLWLVSGTYTALSLGVSILLWSFLSAVPILEAKPLFLIHPIFALEIILLFSIVILWSVTSLLSIKSILNQKLMLRKIVERNSLLISLVFITIVIAISGCLVFSEVPFIERPLQVGDLHIIYGISPPNPYAVLYGLGILFCEPTWIALVILKSLKC